LTFIPNAERALCPRSIAARATSRRLWRAAAALLLLAPLLSHGVAAEEQKAGDNQAPVVDGAAPPVNVRIYYLGKVYDEPVPLSLVDKVLTGNGLQGARLAIKDRAAPFSARTMS